jgi:uncharacterized NAD(P)/FAD-binding protein YdhS
VTPSVRTIAIVGGGFSGTVVAAHLLRLSYWKPLRVVLVERTGDFGRGAAYARSSYPYVLNVPAGRMSGSSRDPMEFLRFARPRQPGATSDDFLPRSLFGDYLQSLLREAELGCPPHVRLERVQGDVRSIERLGGLEALRLKLADGRLLSADDVVLALGNPPPARLPGADALGLDRYIDSPWMAPPAINPGETVLVVGTGLTMADAVVAGADQARDRVVFHAISRHGLIPPSQSSFRFRQERCEGDSGVLLRAASFSARRLMRAVRELAEDLERQGGDWREAVTFVRNLAPALWQRLSTRERRRFLRHARIYWDIHRHRLPQQTLAALEQLRQNEKLQVHAGHIVDLTPDGERVRVAWRPRGSTETRTLFVDRVINCTGPDYNSRRSRDPLLCSLLSQGLITADPLGLGLRTSANGALIDARGRVAADLYYIGPMLRADHWESTAAQELRGHAERLARHLTAPAIATGRLAGAV